MLSLSPFLLPGAWCVDHAKALAKDRNQYLQLNLGAPTTIGMIETQGQYYYPNFVTKFSLNCSVDGVNWVSYGKVWLLLGQIFYFEHQKKEKKAGYRWSLIRNRREDKVKNGIIYLLRSIHVPFRNSYIKIYICEPTNLCSLVWVSLSQMMKSNELFTNRPWMVTTTQTLELIIILALP